VSAPFTILPEELAEKTGALGEAAIALMTSAATEQKEAAAAFTERLQAVARSFEGIYQEANSSTLSVHAALAEAARQNAEQALFFLQCLISAKGPLDAMGLQFSFLAAQAQLFAGQARALQREYARLLPQSWLPAGDC
jgi:hypothetical protein